jgi:hypothetical protein
MGTIRTYSRKHLITLQPLSPACQTTGAAGGAHGRSLAYPLGNLTLNFLSLIPDFMHNEQFDHHMSFHMISTDTLQ